MERWKVFGIKISHSHSQEGTAMHHGSMVEDSDPSGMREETHIRKREHERQTDRQASR